MKQQGSNIAFPHNQRIYINHLLFRDSFAKLYSLTEVDSSDFSSIIILNNGNNLGSDEMNKIIQGLSTYNA